MIEQTSKNRSTEEFFLPSFARACVCVCVGLEARQRLKAMCACTKLNFSFRTHNPRSNSALEDKMKFLISLSCNVKELQLTLLYYNYNTIIRVIIITNSFFVPLLKEEIKSRCRLSREYEETIYYYYYYYYCNKFAGSISRWKFITLKAQYTTVEYSSQHL
jgi:hypothetical protein